MSDLHIGRNWVAPDPFAPGCGCTVLACGLVSSDDANGRECDQHSILAARTIRITHADWECPSFEPCDECEGTGRVFSHTSESGVDHDDECDVCSGVGYLKSGGSES